MQAMKLVKTTNRIATDTLPLLTVVSAIPISINRRYNKIKFPKLTEYGKYGTLFVY